MTHAIENFNHIADAVNSVLRRGIVLIDREDKIRAATLLVADRLPEFSRAELKSALRQISVINQDPNLRPIQPTNGGTPPPGGGFPHEQEFRRFLKETRIMGEPAINSYVSFINGASNDLGESVPRILLAWTGAPEEIVTRLAKLMTENDCHPKTINNRKTAMRAYLEMTAKYGLRARPLGKPENGGAPTNRNPPNGNTLPITLDPQSADEFKDALLKNRNAYITVHYMDGRQETSRWRATRILPSSNIIGNLRSRPQFRRKEWQKRGIAKVAVSIQKPQDAD